MATRKRLTVVWVGTLLGASQLAIAIGLTIKFSVDVHWLFIYTVTAVLGVSANGSVGLFFAELARLSPPEETSTVAGGVNLSCISGLSWALYCSVSY